MDRADGLRNQQALLWAEEIVLVDFLEPWVLQPSVGMVKSVAEEIAYYCHKDTNYDPLTVVLKLGINWMARFQDRNP